ncbi:alpha/beta fold hydrolase [Streptomyces genisteinicus]|uniref:Alpha/beta fold hydrolase n=1 Tax=Streptomyces genisteinicus TaxID=2768068 RepID=A0A7H0HMV9_9ACTN|nr:alpha/beta fold hydrolase [Streptomyces genisteinicus]QNP61875.1 alpha/beta fold hydrolase [Streptomyces genisteinicus]
MLARLAKLRASGPTARTVVSALTGPLPLSRGQALGASERIAALTSLLSSLEHLTLADQKRPGGLNDWALARRGHAHSGRPLRKLLDIVADERTSRVLHTARVAASAALLLPGDSRARGAANLFLGLSGALLYPTHRYGTDGSDQASGLVQTATGLARLAPSPAAQDALMWYVALQSNMSYVVSGWVKLLGKDWRDGSALTGVLRTRTYGHEKAWRLARRHPRSARALAHGVLAMECLFPVLYLRGGLLTRPVIAGAVAFHLANGSVMGLGRFIPAFVSMHPLVAYTSTPRSHPAVAGRDDRMPAAAALLLAGTAAAAAAAAVRRGLRATDHPFGSTVTTRHGNELAYDGTIGTAGEGPVAVLVHGLGALPAHFSWYTRALNAGGRPWLAYSRAGYGASKRHSSSPYHLGESVDDLVDLIEAAVPEGRQVSLVGHSLGGELARRAAVRLGERVHSVVYVDSSHPQQLDRSSRQGENAQHLEALIRSTSVSLRAGLGVLMQTPGWIRNLPAPVRDRAMAELADHRMWTAALREWRAAEADFRSFEGPLPRLESHALVLSAQQTVDSDPDHLLLHKDLADAHPADRTVRSTVVENADHDSLLTDPQLAGEAARHLLAFLGDTTAALPGAGPGRQTTTGQPSTTDQQSATARQEGTR